MNNNIFYIIIIIMIVIMIIITIIIIIYYYYYYYYYYSKAQSQINIESLVLEYSPIQRYKYRLISSSLSMFCAIKTII